MAGATNWRTPPAVFRSLFDEFHFTVDAAASDENALVRPCQCGAPGTWCDGHNSAIGKYYTAENDALEQSYYRERVFCNPPYSPAKLLYRFVEHAARSAREELALWVMLLNATTTDTRWFHDFIWDGHLHRPRGRVELRLLRGRIAFHGELNTPIPSPRYSNMLVIFHPEPLR